MELQVDRRASPEPMSKRAINRSESSARLSRLSGLSGLWVLPRMASVVRRRGPCRRRHSHRHRYVIDIAIFAMAIVIAIITLDITIANRIYFGS